MVNTYTKIYIHAILAVKDIDSLIPKTFAHALYNQIAEIIKNEEQMSIQIGGVPDHIHLAFAIDASISVSDMIQTIKLKAAKWINEQLELEYPFEWQEGYGAFSYGQSQLPMLAKYIANQEAFHFEKTFKEEYLRFLKVFRIDFEDEKMFEWLDYE